MRINKLLSILASAVLLLSGCITIEEHYSFKKNGSGSMTYVIDMTEMGEMMKTFGDEMDEAGVEDEEGEDDSMDLGDVSFEEMLDTLNTLSGISKVSVNDKNEWIHKISFSFKDLDALNNALNVLMNDKGKSVDHVFFRKDGNKIIRQHNESAEDLGEEMSEEEDDMGILESMKYKMTYSFKGKLKDVKGGTGSTTTMGAKTFELDTDFKNISENEDALDLTFTFE